MALLAPIAISLLAIRRKKKRTYRQRYSLRRLNLANSALTQASRCGSSMSMV